jgi:hypothetical protein
MTEAIDSELLMLLSRLNKVQKEVGGGKKNMLQAGGDRGGVDRFLDLSERMRERLENIKTCIEEIRKLEKIPGSNPTELITNQSKVRSELIVLGEEYKEIDSLYRLEKKKKRSRFKPEELAARGQIVQQIAQSVQEIKEMQRSNFVKGIETKRMVIMEESELFRKQDLETGPPGSTPVQARGVVGSRNNQMTDLQRDQLMIIKQRDHQVDEAVEEIGKGLDILRELAMQANQEVKLQNTMLDQLEEKVGDVQEKVLNLNERMKDTLEKAREGDKICMDIVCLVILIGMIIVLVKLSTANA